MHVSRLRSLLLPVLIVWLALSVSPVAAQSSPADRRLGSSAQQLPAYLAKAGVEQRLGQSLPLPAMFTDEGGHTAALSSFFTGKPAVLALVYYRCAMLCPQVLHGLADGLRQSTLHAGKDYDVLVFSISPDDTPQDASIQKAQFAHDANLGPADVSAVHFLTGSKNSIDAISGATGFHYVLVPGPDGKLNQYAHSSVIMFATPDGRLSKYISGINYAPRDLRMAVLGASEHRISNPVDLLILYCCSYNPVVGRYTVSVMRVLSLAGMVAVVVVIGMLFLLARKPQTHAAG